MAESALCTVVDGESVDWKLQGELSNFEQQAIPPLAQALFNRLGEAGYQIIRIPEGIRDVLQSHVRHKLAQVTGQTIEDIGTYHHVVNEKQHMQVIESFRESRFADFGGAAQGWVKDIERQMGLTLQPLIRELARDHIQIRTVRPGLSDFNPPHKDAYLRIWHEVLNIWIPINYLGPSAIMPICPGSHLWDESHVTRTDTQGAQMGTSRYNVPAVVAYHGQPLQMMRPALTEKDCLAFTPYLVHGFGRNNTTQTRFALELRLQIVQA